MKNNFNGLFLLICFDRLKGGPVQQNVVCLSAVTYQRCQKLLRAERFAPDAVRQISMCLAESTKAANQGHMARFEHLTHSLEHCKREERDI